MEFNKIIRGNKRQVNEEQTVFDILDAGFMCTIAFTHQNQAMMIPTTYGRIGDVIYFHGSTKNFMMNEALKNDQICISVTHLDGLVLAKSLFNTSANYRSVVLFGKAELVENEEEWMKGLEAITENIIPNRWNEVKLGSENELKATMVVKMKIEKASAKIRDCGPQGDENDGEIESWSGHIPLKIKALDPITDDKFDKTYEFSQSVKLFMAKYK